MQLTERFRPRQWAEVVGQDKALRQLDALRRHGGLGGRAYFLSGASGTGKTSIGRLIAAEVAGGCVCELDAGDLTVAKLDAIRADLKDGRPLPYGGVSGRAWIVNEVHGLNVLQVRRVLSLIEPDDGIPSWAVFVFTTTVEGKASLFEGCDDAHPFLSRCQPLALSRRDLCQPFADMVVRNCRTAGILNGKPDSYYVARATAFLKSNKNNARALYQAADAGYLTDSDHDETEG